MFRNVLTDRAAIGALASIAPKQTDSLSLGGGVMLAQGRVHEVLGESSDVFAFCVAARLPGAVIWAGLGRDLSSLTPSGAQALIDPARLILTEGISRADILFAGEQALRCGGAACVVMELEHGPDLTESRRLQLAAEESGTIGLILIGGRAHTSAAETRWHCQALPGAKAAWRWECSKNRKGDTGIWRADWLGGEYGPDLIHMAACTTA